METGPDKHHKIVQNLQENNASIIESALMDLMFEIEASPAHVGLPLSLQAAVSDLVRQIIKRSWSDENLAIGFFVLGKTVIYPGTLDVTKIASEIILEVANKNEARQVLVAVENQILTDQRMDLNAAKLVLDFLRESPECWNNDSDLRDRVIEELNSKIHQSKMDP